MDAIACASFRPELIIKLHLRAACYMLPFEILMLEHDGRLSDSQARLHP